jgi:uncharacterized protein
MQVETLVESVIKGDSSTVQLLLEDNPELLTYKTNKGETLGILAAYYQRQEVLDILYSRHYVLNIHEAAAIGKIDVVKEILAESPKTLNAYSHDGYTPLCLASYFGNLDIVVYLLSKAAKVNLQSENYEKVTPLHSAVSGGNVEIAKVLLDNGADVNAQQKGYVTPLHLAAQTGQKLMVRLLLIHKANVNIKMLGGKTALAMARETGNEEIIKMLIHNGGIE